jgi:hypothetical protein
VIRRSQAIADALKAQAESKAAPLESSAPPAPAPNAAETTPPVAATAPPVPAIPAAPASAPAADPRESDPEYWKQRFKATAGVLDSVRRERVTEREQYQQRFDELQTQIRDLQAKAPAAKLNPGDYFTPEQIEQFGEAQCEAMALAAHKAAQTSVQRAIEAEVQPLRDQRKRETAQDLEDRKAVFREKLAESIPNYAEIDVGEDWHAWLAQPESEFGEQRQATLDRHVAAFDAARVAKMFKAFLSTKAATPVPPVTAAPAAAPTPSETPAAASDVAVKAPTKEEIRDFYKRAALGRVKDAERVAFEQRLEKLRGSQ